MLLYDPRFTTVGPTFAADTEVCIASIFVVASSHTRSILNRRQAWSVFLQAQQAITSATQFVIDLDTRLKLKMDVSDMWDRMLELDTILEPLLAAADNWHASSPPPVGLDCSELCVAQALRGITRLKLNR